MERKIIKQGVNTMTISLPSFWVKKFNLNGGDLIKLTENNQSIIISTEKMNIKKEINIDLKGKSNRFVFRKLIGLYQAGYDKIEIKFDTQFDAISQITNQLIGFVIMKEEKDCCTIEDLSGIKHIDFNEIYKRCFTVLIDFYEKVLEMIIEDKELINLDIMDYKLNQITDYCLRYLNKKGHENFEKTSLYYTVVSQIELIGDLLTKIGLIYDFNQKEIVIELFEKNINLLKNFYRFSLNIISEKDIDIISEAKEIEKKYYNSNASSIVIQLLQVPLIVKDLFNIMLNLKD